MQGGAGHAPSGEGKVSSEPGRWAGESQRGEGEDLEPQPAVTGRWSAGLPPCPSLEAKQRHRKQCQRSASTWAWRARASSPRQSTWGAQVPAVSPAVQGAALPSLCALG